MDRSRGVHAAPKVQVRQLTQPTKKYENWRDHCETLYIGKAVCTQRVTLGVAQKLHECHNILHKPTQDICTQSNKVRFQRIAA